MFGPNILANRRADFFPVEIERLDVGRRLEIAVLIENIVSRQERFVGFANRLTAYEQRSRVMKWPASAFVPVDKSDQQRCLPDAAMKFLHNLERFRNEARLEDKVLWRIPGDREFWCDNKFGTSGGQ